MIFFDRIKETSTSTGTSTFTLSGAAVGYKAFTNGTYKYCIVNSTETEWEVGEGTVASGVLTRTTIEASSNSGSTVNFSAGTKYVFNTVSAAYVNSLVPYTGATASVNLGEFGLTAGQLTLDTTPTGTAVVGTTQWNDTIGSSQTLLKGGNVLLKNGVDLVARVVNKVSPATTLTKAAYQAVRVSGAQGQRLAVAYAQANNDNNSADTIGLVCETIAANQEGFIMTVGQLLDVNTTGSLQGETWADGDVLYLSPTTAGSLTNVKPNGSTGHIVIIGYVEYAHANNGKIYVKVMNGWELDELHNVYISSVANNQVLTYESATDLWKNKSIATALGYTPANDSLVMHLAGTETATGVKTFSIGLATTTGDNFLNTSSGNLLVGYSATPGTNTYKLNVNGTTSLGGKLTVQSGTIQKFLYTDTSSGVQSFSIGTGYELFGTLHSAGGYTTYLTTSNLGGGWNIIIGSETYKSLEVNYNNVATNVDFRAKAGMSNITGNGSMVTYFSSPYEGFKPTTSNGWGFGIFNSANSIMMAVKNTGQFVLSGYTSTSVFTGTVAGLLGFDSSGNIITTSASGGISGSGTAGQVTYWSGTSAVTGSSNLFWDNTNGRLGIGTSSPAAKLSVGNPLTLNTTALNEFVTTFGTNVNSTSGIQMANTNAGSLAEFRFAITDDTNDPYVAFTAASSTNNATVFGNARNTFFGLISNVNTGTARNILIGNYPNKDIILATNNAERLRLKGGGNLLLGTTTDAGYRLDINGTGATDGALRVTGTALVTGASTFQSTLRVDSNFIDNRANSFIQQSSSATASNRDLTFGNGTYGRFNINSKNFLFSSTGTFPSLGSYTYYVNGETSTGGGNGTGIYFKATSAQSGSNGNGGDFIIDTALGDGTGRNSRLGIFVTTPTALADIAASTTKHASLRIRSGTAPTSPNDGDVWYDGTNIYIRVGGSTKTFTLI